MSTLLVIGATGMIGRTVVAEALHRGHTVIAASRRPQEAGGSDRLETVALDVHNPDEVAAAAARADVIVSAVSPRNQGDATAEALSFTTSLIDVQRRTGKRVLMVGGGGTLHLPDGTPVADVLPDAYRAEGQAMRRAYGLLVAEDVDFTVLAPSGEIAPGERTGTFRLGHRQLLLDSHISCEDYAVALLDEVETPKHFRTVFTVGY